MCKLLSALRDSLALMGLRNSSPPPPPRPTPSAFNNKEKQQQEVTSMLSTEVLRLHVWQKILIRSSEKGLVYNVTGWLPIREFQEE